MRMKQDAIERMRKKEDVNRCERKKEDKRGKHIFLWDVKGLKKEDR